MLLPRSLLLLMLSLSRRTRCVALCRPAGPVLAAEDLQVLVYLRGSSEQQARSSASSLITPARGGCQHGAVAVSQLAAEVLKGPLLFLVYSGVSVCPLISTEALSL